MAPYWHKVSAVLGGVDAMRATAATSVAGPHIPVPTLSQLNRGAAGPVSPFLPKFPNETGPDYEVRRSSAPMTNIYDDVSSNLSSKPFSKTCELTDGSAADLKKLQEDIDGQGNNLHVFSRTLFKAGLDKAIAWVLVDYTKVPLGATLADERDMGARPYWVFVPAERLLAVYSKFVAGKEVICHARIYEPCTEQRGYGEAQYERVRVFNREPLLDSLGNIYAFGPAVWELWEERDADASQSAAAIAAGAQATAAKKTWVPVDGGFVTIGIIPLVPFVTGQRHGTSWRVTPPLRNIVDMQVEEFQQESSLKHTRELTAFPMLTGNGVSQPKNDQGEALAVPVGPQSVLFAPMSESGQHGSWAFIEPAATSLVFLSGELEKLQNKMRELGMQPLMSANLTVITSANVALKAHNAVQAWALGLKDALEQCMRITCAWLGRPKEQPTVNVHTEFLVEVEDKGPDYLLRGQQQGIFSKLTVREELKRRRVLSDDYEPEDEDERIASEGDSLTGEEQIDPRTGLPVAPPGELKPPPQVTVQ